MPNKENKQKDDNETWKEVIENLRNNKRSRSTNSLDIEYDIVKDKDDNQDKRKSKKNSKGVFI